MKKIEKELAKYFLKENDFVNIDNMKVKVLYLCNTKTFKSSEYDFVCTRRYVAYGKNKLTHAFEWEIVIEAFGRMTIRQYADGKTARREFNNYKKKR